MPCLLSTREKLFLKKNENIRIPKFSVSCLICTLISKYKLKGKKINFHEKIYLINNTERFLRKFI